MSLGHTSDNGMEKLSRKGLLDGQKTSKLQFCEHCVFGNISEIDSLKAFISQRGCLTIYIKIFRDLQKYLLWEVLLI